MKSEKLKSAVRTLLFAAAATGTLLVAPQAHSSPRILRQEPVPTNKDVIRLAQTAMGGPALFDPKPYITNYTVTSENPTTGQRTIKSKETYKNGKLRLDSTIWAKRKNKVTQNDYRNITYLDKDEAWEYYPAQAINSYRRARNVSVPLIPYFNKSTLEGLIFDNETVGIIEHNNTQFYKLEAKFGDPKFENWRIAYLINTKNNLIYGTEQTNTLESAKTVRTYEDYRFVDGIAIPFRQSITTDIKGRKSSSHTTISDFLFSDDIPDLLFELPVIEAEFKTSNAHPKWVSPDPELENRLKANVVDIVRGFPERSFLNPETLDKVAKHIEEILKGTGGRIEKREFQWHDGRYKKTDGTYSNIYASYGPESGPRIVIGAHYDAMPGSPAADDNASAVAVLLELAKCLGKNPPPIRVDLAAYTLEEPGTIGSAVHAKDLKTRNVDVKAMIALEMLGYFSDEPNSQLYPLGILKLFYPSKGNYISVIGKWGTGGLVKRVKKSMAKATPLPVKSLTAPVSKVGDIQRSDHKPFWDQGYLAVMVTDTANLRNFYYHSIGDIPERLDYRRMAMVTVALEKTIRDLCGK